MKITISKDSKRILTLSDMEGFKIMKESFKEQEQKDFDWEAASAIALASDNKVSNVIKYECELSKNSRIYNYYGEGTGQLDIWFTIYAFDSYYGFYSVGAYLSDIWSLGAHNREEIKSHMFIQHFIKEG